MTLQEKIFQQASEAKQASKKLAQLKTSVKNAALIAMANALENETNQEKILQANQQDITDAKQNKIKSAFLDRLLLTKARLLDMAAGLKQVAQLADPVGSGNFRTVRPNGLEISCMKVPLGVIGIVYEARPNVTADAMALCLKSGNAVILRGGKEAIHSNRMICEILSNAAYANGIPFGAIQLIDSIDREGVNILMKARNLIDVLIPRGGSGLIQKMVRESDVPVIETGAGICHTFVDETADLQKAEEIILNAKTSRPSVCNAMETLLIHEKIAEKFLPKIAESLAKKSVELRGCEICCKLCPEKFLPATEEDWATEYDDLILSVKIVKNLDEAIAHINRYNTQHSDAIVTNGYEQAQKFLHEVDSACVYVNASTRFSDGFEFGFGAEIGISTQKLHARGPMGLDALTTTKYFIQGNGQIR